MKSKKILFYALLLAPGLALCSLLLATMLDLYAISAQDPAKMARELEAELAGKEPASFPLPDKLGELEKTKKTVFLFGESSLVLSDGGTFPEYLESEHPGIQTVNFGVSGIDSFSVRQRVTEALAAASPDLIVLYFGHNDYNNAYQGVIIPGHYERFDALLRIPFFLHDPEKPSGVLSSDTFYWYSRYQRPRLIQFFERLHLVNLDIAQFAPVNRLILAHYIRNTETILDLAAARKIPVVVLTPVGNLRAEPFGDLKATTALYRRGMASAGSGESLQLLRRARDAEIMTYDLRAKTPLLEYLRSLRRRQVYVLDLERRLEERGFTFGYEDFLDYFHFNDRTHRLVADIIFNFLVDKRLIAPVAGRRHPGGS